MSGVRLCLLVEFVRELRSLSRRLPDQELHLC
jgi:hypothetical protein